MLFRSVRRIYLGNPAESARFAAAGTTSYESTNQSGKTTASSASNGADKVVRRVADKTERVDGPVSESTQAPHAKKNILDRFALRRRS